VLVAVCFFTVVCTADGLGLKCRRNLWPCFVFEHLNELPVGRCIVVGPVFNLVNLSASIGGT
jgi:hypothetical protein